MFGVHQVSKSLPESSEHLPVNSVVSGSQVIGKAAQKHPGRWETGLAVKHFVKKNSSGAVAPYTFLDQHYLNFFRAEFNDFEGMTWYLQGFVLRVGCSLFTSALDVSLLQAFA